MEFGVCSGIENAPLAKSQGWDFIEGNVQGILKGTEDAWTVPPGFVEHGGAPLPMPAANCLVPAHLKITGPDADLWKLEKYLTHVLTRAPQVGMKVLVFGSGGARHVPEGWDRKRAFDQIVDFLKLAAPLAHTHGVTIVVEPLNKKECNIINSVGEALTYVQALEHPAIKGLVDSYHFWLEHDSLEELRTALPTLAHVHVADKEGRVGPGESGKADYRSFFGVLKRGGYHGRISVEAGSFDLATHGARVLAFLRREWEGA